MKFFLSFIIIFFNFVHAYSANDLMFFIESAYKNNPKLNAERENLKSIKENVNISRSEFLPNVTVTGSQDSKHSTKRTDQSGSDLSDISRNTSKKSISVDQKIFQGFENFNSMKKSRLEVEQANYKLKKIEQETILESVTAYYDLIYKIKKKDFNLANVDLLERQVESDKARLQKGEITLTDLAQSESSLAGASANSIAAENEFLNSKTNFERIIRVSAPETMDENFNLRINLPANLRNVLKLSEENSPKLIIAKLDYEIAEREVSIERAKLSPSASINYSRSKSNDYSSVVDDIEEESVKATVTWPIIKGGENVASLKKSKFKREKSNLILQDTANQVKSTTTNAWSSYQSAESVLVATEAQVRAAEIANEGITLEYDSGNTRTTLEVIQSRSLLLNARIDHAKAERDLITSKLKLMVAIGSLSLDNIK